MNAFEVVGSYVLKGADKAAAGAQKVGKSAEKSSSKLKKMTKNIGLLGKKLGSVAVKMAKFGAAGVAAAGIALFAYTKKLGDTADRLLDLSAITGASVKEIQGWQNAAEMAGTSTDAFSKSIRFLGTQQQAMRRNAGPVSEALADMGISASALAKQDLPDQVEFLIHSLQKIPDRSERARRGVELFGRQWEILAPIVDLGAKALNDARFEGEKSGMSKKDAEDLNAFRQGIVGISREFGVLGRKIALLFLPLLKDQLLPFIKNTLIPFLEDFAWMLVEVGQKGAEGAAGLSFFGKAVLALVAVIPALAGLGVGIIILKQFSFVITILSGALGLLNIAMLPFIATVAAVTIIIGGLYFIFTHWNDVLTGAAEVWKIFSSVVVEALDTAAETIKAWGPWVFGLLLQIAAGIQGVWNELWVDLASMVAEKIDSFITKFKELPGKLLDAIKSMPGVIMGALRSLGNGMVDWAHSVVSSIVGAFSQMISFIRGSSAAAQQASAQVTRQMQAQQAASSAQQSRSRSTASAVNYNIDMRHSILRDDRDLSDRLTRSGVGMAGI